MWHTANTSSPSAILRPPIPPALIAASVLYEIFVNDNELDIDIHVSESFYYE